MLAPKVAGTVLLDAATADQALDFFVLYSSVVGSAGNLGQADYAAANAFLNSFAELRERLRERGERHGRTVAIGWPLWADGGMTVDDATAQLLARRWSMVPMRTGVGLDVFRRAAAGSDPCLVVVELAGTAQPPAEPEPSVAEPSVAEPSMAERAVAEPAVELVGVVRTRLRALAAGFLLVDPAEVGLTDDLLDTGFDSVSLTELINEVNQAYGLDLLPTVLFECATLDAFAGYLVPSMLPRWRRRRPPSRPEPERRRSATEPPATEPPATEPVATGPEPDARAVTAPPSTAGAVAIVGMAGTLPGAPDLDGFWRRLVAGEHLVGPAPADRLELHAHPDTAGVRGGFLADVAGFDAELFRVSPTEAALMDPQQRLFLQAAWRAIEDAGYRPDGARRQRHRTVRRRVHNATTRTCCAAPVARSQAHTASGIVALRSSPTACRTCSTCTVRARRWTPPAPARWSRCTGRSRRSPQASATRRSSAASTSCSAPGSSPRSPGPGCSARTPPARRSTRDADGYVRGEGVGAVLLKPLAAALADGDQMLRA